MINHRKIDVFTSELNLALVDYQSEIVLGVENDKKKEMMMGNVCRAIDALERVKTYVQNAETIGQDAE